MKKVLVVTPLIVLLITFLFGIAYTAETPKQTIILWESDCYGSHQVDPIEGNGNHITCYANGTPSPTNTAIPSTPTPTGTSPGFFFESFNSATPATPEPFVSNSHWEISVHSRNNLYLLDTMAVDHGLGCEAPPTIHTNNTFDGAVFLCNKHLMTGLLDDQYGVIYMTPATLLNFIDGGIVSWRMSTFRNSMARDWIDIWITPFQNHLQLPLQNSFPDLQGIPCTGLLIRMQATRNSFEVFRYENCTSTRIGGGFTGYETVLTPDKVRRDLFQIELSPTNIKVFMPEYNFIFVNKPLSPPLTWTNGVIQFGHHSYNPFKDGDLGPTTWHWDEFSINPSLPLSIIPADRRYYQANQDTALFSSSSVVDSHLRFAGIGSSLQFSLDDGITWQDAQKQPSGLPYDSGHFASFMTSIPVGVTSIKFKGNSWYGGSWHIRNVSIVTP